MLAILVVIAAILYQVGPGKCRPRYRAACTSNLRQLGLALGMYSEDHDAFPPRTSWPGHLMPHLRTGRIFQCPSEEKAPVGYAYARYLAGHGKSSVPDPERVFTFWDADPGTQDPSFRHDDGLNIAYVDGHVKWASREDVFARLLQQQSREATTPAEDP